ncbi:hypothetical protein KC332_g13367 [Hortaea werneckii]|uniref:Uncharacterized protein n=1 Tax=Hortaea werneckii EXF-2000 TaxID=1157616 RepID=A0A1Z5SMY6_HORWE|nr:hypothetical protein KC329_g13490 [Hortaea werneckii]OTA22179.1 hypothetical protein BTJ68_14367 [Hortaea werneckii EXF-2000]KAI7062698.1 hypothetical protein KC327_g13293 [Hortaea werneckii]KAI7392205.1 hypothetical protein KC332_g13367 [Hortaea werneckii]KAI7437603.1 hypothetical protein KC368_g12557 [Hortaea werneckii]
MGLPIWRDPTETQPKPRDALKSDRTAAARSSIRRRPSIHGRQGSQRPRLMRDATLPRFGFERPSMPDAASSEPLEPLRGIIVTNVPAVSTLLESSPERNSESNQDSSRGARAAQLSARATLPTPPMDQSDPDAEVRRPSHPLSNEWRPHSPVEGPVDGLGDRNRSPTPMDGWEIMRGTIDPDPTLPSTDSSFTSAAASQSFNSHPATNITEPEQTSARASYSDRSQRTRDHESTSDTSTSFDADDLACEDDETTVRQMVSAENFAEDMYEFEISTSDGRQRVLEQEHIRSLNGNRFALPHESPRIDIGFRLIEEALESEEGRERLFHIGAFDGQEDLQTFMNDRRNPSRVYPQNGRRTRPAHMSDFEGESSHPATSRSRRAGEASAEVDNFFNRYTADSLIPAHARTTSPPPRYSPTMPDGPLASHPDVDTFVSRDAPEAHPVSPPTHRSHHDVTMSLFNSGPDDLDAMRRIVERLARRDDVPDSWWMSMGLNLSRTRPQSARSSRRGAGELASPAAAGNRVQTGRVERGTSRL